MIKLKLNQPLPATIKRILTAYKTAALFIGGYSFITDHPTATILIGASVMVTDILCDLFFGEEPIVTLDKAAKKLEKDQPGMKVTVICTTEGEEICSPETSLNPIG